MQHSASVRRGRAKEIPFGVRALEKGVEVAGVWNSGVTTPAASAPNSPTLSAKANKGKTPGTQSPNGSTASTLLMTHTKLSSSSSLPPSTVAEQPLGQAAYRPRRSSGLRFTDSCDKADGDATLAVLRGRSNPGESRDNRRSISWSGSSSNYVQESTNQRASTEASLRNDGLLHPTYYSPSLRPIRTSQESNPFLTPTTTRISTDEPIPLATLEDVGSLQSDNVSAVYHAQMLGNTEIVYDEGHARPIQPFETGRQTSNSQVLRKIDPGSEIENPFTTEHPGQTDDVAAEWSEDCPSRKKQPRKSQRKNRQGSIGVAGLKT